MKKTGLAIFTLLQWIFFLVSSITFLMIGCVIWLLTRWFDKRLLILHLWSSFWAACYIWVNPLWRVRITGRKKIPWNRPCILVSNHQSMLDILVLYSLFAPFKWVSKKSNYKIPILGWQMRLNNYLEIERGRKQSLVKLLEKAEKMIGVGCSILLFPEGTRHPGGKLGRFREGAFKMALENKVDIIPIVLEGTARALPKKGIILTGFSNMRARVLDPVPYSEFADKSAGELSNDIRDIMSAEYEKLCMEMQTPRENTGPIKQHS